MRQSGKPRLAKIGPYTWREIQELQPVEPVRDHILHLRSWGFTDVAIASVADTSPQEVRFLRHLTRWVYPDLAARLLAVTPERIYREAPDNVRVPTYGVVRRMRALSAMGWPTTMFEGARHAHLYSATSVALWREMDAEYRRRGFTEGPNDQVRERARRAGWATPMAWDPAALDDPDGMPDLDEPGSSVEDRGAVVAEETETLMLEFGVHPFRVAEALGINWDSLLQSLHRSGREDLVEECLRRKDRSAGLVGAL